MIYNNIKKHIKECEACPLHKELEYGCTPQWGCGSYKAKILVVNLRMTREAHLLEKPLETKLSLLLRKIISDAGLSESDIFVTNLLKCHGELTPAKAFNDNLTICRKTWFCQELESMPFQAIVAMGKKTLSSIVNNNKLSFNDMNDEIIYNINDRRVFATYSLEEIFRKSSTYMQHAITTFKNVKGTLYA